MNRFIRRSPIIKTCMKRVITLKESQSYQKVVKLSEKPKVMVKSLYKTIKSNEMNIMKMAFIELAVAVPSISPVHLNTILASPEDDGT